MTRGRGRGRAGLLEKQEAGPILASRAGPTRVEIVKIKAKPLKNHENHNFFQKLSQYIRFFVLMKQKKKIFLKKIVIFNFQNIWSEKSEILDFQKLNFHIFSNFS